jgi:hypothetical protein
MPRIEIDHTTSRRRFLGGSGAAALAAATITTPAVAAAQQPDAELIRLSDQFVALERRIEGFFSGGATPIDDDNERDVARAPLEKQQRELAARMCAMRPQTLAGFVALASALVAWAPDLAEAAEGDCIDDQIVAALLRDLTGAV